MTRFILVRHGQSMANVDGIFAGYLDTPLSPLGYEQAEVTAKYISENYKVDKVYASDLSRAFDTGKAISEATGAILIKEEGLREICAGEWEGKTFEELKRDFKEDYTLWKTDIGISKTTGGETVIQAQERACKTLLRIAKENEDKTVVIATHAHPIRTVMCAWKNLPPSEMKNVPWVTNASVTVAEYEDGNFTIKSVGYDGHLTELKSALPTFV